MVNNTFTITKKLFGGEVDFIIYDSSREFVEMIIEEVYEEALRLQKIFNFYDPESELSKLNKSGRKKVSKELLLVIKQALKLSELTNGSYDVTLGKSILKRKKGEFETGDIKLHKSYKCTYRDLLIKSNEVILTNPEVMIDLGSIAKGYITDKLAEQLSTRGVEEFMIDARGDICVKGKLPKVLGIQDPRGEKVIRYIKLLNQGVATSGDYKQYVKNFDNSHIMNQKNDSSITVVAPTLEEADLYATALFTCSREDQKRLLSINKNIKVMIIDKRNVLKMFNNFESLLYEDKQT